MSGYPTLPPPSAAKKEEVFYCPFGCKGNECDDKGYCGHLVGFTIDMATVEPIMELMRHDRSKGGWYPTGFLMTSGAYREQLQPGDVTVNPIVREKLPKEDIEYEKYSLFSFRVYSNNPDRMPIPIQGETQVGPKVKNRAFEFNHRKRAFEQQLAAPSPNDDVKVNPRKRALADAIEKDEKLAKKKAKSKKRISTAQANEPAAEPVAAE